MQTQARSSSVGFGQADGSPFLFWAFSLVLHIILGCICAIKLEAITHYTKHVIAYKHIQ